MFDYDLPLERIAQRPVSPADSAKLLVVRRKEGTLEERTFADLHEILAPGDLLVRNTTKVIPARLLGVLKDSQSKIEVLLLRDEGQGCWQVMAKPVRKLKPGTQVVFGERLIGTVREQVSERVVRLELTPQERFVNEKLSALIEAQGIMPIPPYIRKGVGDARDKQDYQTLFAKEQGSIAAPTASLHFTPELLVRLEKYGVRFEEVLLHLGAASFLALFEEPGAPLVPPGAETVVVDGYNPLGTISEIRAKGGRSIAVGTSVVRALETVARAAQSGSVPSTIATELFIQPGFSFLAVDALITNFHQPRTTHLLLVEALLGEKLLRESYHYALGHDFRFLSYGDAMLIL